MNFNDVRKNENKGFSLVELIVTIAIMAVMVTVLAPALLQYVEKSRMQKDDSAMGELTNVIQLALSDQDIYDEVLRYSCYGNVSCYIDRASETDSAYGGETDVDGDFYVLTKKFQNASGTAADKSYIDQYMFTDDVRQLDEVEYYFAGNMRGVTITFQPTEDGTYVLKDGVVNKALEHTTLASTLVATGRDADTVKYFQASNEPTWANNGALGTMTKKEMTDKTVEHHYLYNRVRVNIGDSITLSSQTYRNSDYTVFIRMGSTGGNDASAADAVKVYGQWNGTNLEYNQVAADFVGSAT